MNFKRLNLTKLITGSEAKEGSKQEKNKKKQHLNFKFIVECSHTVMLTSSPELRLKQSVEELADQDNGKGEDSNGSSNGKSTHHHQGELQIQQQLQQQQQPQRPTLEETVDSLLKRLKEKRQALGLPENMLVSERASVTLPSVATVCLVRLCVVALPWLCVCVCMSLFC